MIFFVTVMSWLAIGFTLDLIGVFDCEEPETDASGNGAEAAQLLESASPLDAAYPVTELEQSAVNGATIHENEAELGMEILREELGENGLATLSTLDLTDDQGAMDETGEDALSFLKDGSTARMGAPAKVLDFDLDDETIVFAYDPAQTPQPRLSLQDGDANGQKVLTLNGNVVVEFENCPNLTLADINFVETRLGA